jgi:hypothetical protein
MRVFCQQRGLTGYQHKIGQRDERNLWTTIPPLDFSTTAAPDFPVAGPNRYAVWAWSFALCAKLRKQLRSFRTSPLGSLREAQTPQGIAATRQFLFVYLIRSKTRNFPYISQNNILALSERPSVPTGIFASASGPPRLAYTRAGCPPNLFSGGRLCFNQSASF